MPAQRVDIPDKMTGRFSYVQDVRVPGMLHGRVIRPPAIGSSLIRIDGFSRPRPDVKVVAKKDFLAVVAPTEWGAIEAARDLKAQWSQVTALPTDLRSDATRHAEHRCCYQECRKY
jgi:nicotinate dehydrogenase subunit B